MMFGKNGRGAPTKVILIDTNIQHANTVDQILKTARKGKFRFEHSFHLEEGLVRIQKKHYDVVIVGQNYPSENVVDLIRSVKERTPSSAILALTTIDDEKVSHRAVKEGAQDCLVLGKFSDESVVRSIRFAVERQKNYHHESSDNVRRLEKILEEMEDAGPE